MFSNCNINYLFIRNMPDNRKGSRKNNNNKNCIKVFFFATMIRITQLVTDLDTV